MVKRKPPALIFTDKGKTGAGNRFGYLQAPGDTLRQGRFPGAEGPPEGYDGTGFKPAAEALSDSFRFGTAAGG